MEKLIIGCVLSTMAITASAQTCNTNIQVTRPDSRYEIMTNGTEVKDKVTGLIWQRCTLGQSWDGNTCTGTATPYTWKDALTQSSNLGNGYRLPNIKELLSLVETACEDPAINTKLFPNTLTTYRSSTPITSIPYVSWYVSFTGGNTWLGYHYPKSDKQYVRAVREER